MRICSHPALLIVFYSIGISTTSQHLHNSLPLKLVNTELGNSVNLTCEIDLEDHIILYEWYKDGKLIVGETQPFLFISEAVPDTRGNYSCKAKKSEALVEVNPMQVAITGTQ